MEAAINRAWGKVAEMEAANPALSGFSKTRPAFVRDEAGLVKAELNFAFNATPYGKDHTPSAADKSKPFCYLIVSVWRPWRRIDLSGQPAITNQPVATQREYSIGKEVVEGYVTLFSSDSMLAEKVRRTFESEMWKAEGKKTGDPTAPAEFRVVQ
jgi:hypothetical protein